MKISRLLVLSTLLAAVAGWGFTGESQRVEKTSGSVLRADGALDKLVPPNAKIEKLADGFDFTEGPLYMPDGYLLFSDVPRNICLLYTSPSPRDS